MSFSTATGLRSSWCGTAADRMSRDRSAGRLASRRWGLARDRTPGTPPRSPPGLRAESMKEVFRPLSHETRTA